MTPERRSPAPPSAAEVEQALADTGRSLLSCAGLAIFGLAQVFGLVALLAALMQVAFGEEGWLPIAAVGAVLLGGGLVLFRKVLRSETEAADQQLDRVGRRASAEELAEAYPDEPWRWNEEWASGRLHSHLAAAGILFAIAATVGTVLALVFATVIWKSNPPDLTNWREDPGGLAKTMLLSVAFFLPGLLLGGLALRFWLVRWRFGSPILEMRSVPAAIGGRLDGRILTGMRRKPKAVRLRLVCSKVGRSRRLRRDPSDSSPSRRTELWSTEQEVAVTDLYPGPKGLIVPVAFEIPDSCRSTDWGHPVERISWRVSLHASVPGIDLEAGWLVPVFEVNAGSAES